MKIGVIGAGSFSLTPFIQKALESCDYLIAVDGGLDHFIGSGIIPNEVIGDFDSMSDDAKRWMNERIITYTQFPSEKDKTDSALALSRAIKWGAKEIIMFGYTGSRLDHTLANILLLVQLRKLGVTGTIIDNNNLIMLIENQIDLIKEEFLNFKYVSVLPLSEHVTLDMLGFKYEVKDLTMEFGANEGRGISNEILSDRAHIRLHDPSDRMLLILSKD